jgi:colicin import membrane protein
MRRVSIQLARLLSAGALLAMLPLVLHAAGSAELLPLRETFPPGSIDSTERADQALAAVDARRALLQSDYIERERECYKKFFSNNCIEDLKASKRMQDADFDSVALEANRFMRNLADQNNKQQKAQKEADARANAARDAAQRSQNRLGYEQKQQSADQKLSDKATRSGLDAGNAAAYSSKVANNTQQQKDRAAKDLQAIAKTEQSEADQKKKEDDAAARRDSLARHRADKAADRARRASEALANGQPAPPGSATVIPDPHKPLPPSGAVGSGTASGAAGGAASGNVAAPGAAQPAGSSGAAKP